MSQSRNFVLLFFVGIALVSCSRSKTISRDELRSDLLSAASLASETELFIDQLQEGRVTPAFAEGHLAYLDKEALRSEKELGQARAGAVERIASAVEIGRAQLAFLTKVLTDLRENNGNKESLSAGRQQAAKIRTILEHAENGL
jgi:hypothetical protein